jgi:hypothetical protein
MIVDKLIPDAIASIFRAEQSRLYNADKKKLKGVARLLYLDGKVKLSKAKDVADSGKGLSLTKIKVDKDEEFFKKKK